MKRARQEADHPGLAAARRAMRIGRLARAAADIKGRGRAFPSRPGPRAARDSPLKFRSRMPICRSKAPAVREFVCFTVGLEDANRALGASAAIMKPYTFDNPSLEHRRDVTKEVRIANLRQSRLRWPVGADRWDEHVSRGRPVDREIGRMSRRGVRFQHLSRVHGRSAHI